MKNRIKAFIKQNKFFYSIYFHFGSIFLRLVGLFNNIDPNLILFISYGGQKYDDSPKVIYEYLLEHPVSSKHKYVWAFTEPDKFLQVSNKVKVDTLAYYIIAMRAGFWITNSSASRGLNFKKAKTKNILFQHGMAGIKKLGIDIHEKDKAFIIGFKEQFDAIFIEGKRRFQFLLTLGKLIQECFIQQDCPVMMIWQLLQTVKSAPSKGG